MTVGEGGGGCTGLGGAGGPGAALTGVPSLPRCFLLGEIEKEEKEKVWYYAQLQSLATRLDELPHVETVSGGVSWNQTPQHRGAGRTPSPSHHPPLLPPQFSMQMDLIRQQLEFEAQHIRSLMEERFGTADEMVQRAQVRVGDTPTPPTHTSPILCPGRGAPAAFPLPPASSSPVHPPTHPLCIPPPSPVHPPTHSPHAPSQAAPCTLASPPRTLSSPPCTLTPSPVHPHAWLWGSRGVVVGGGGCPSSR